MDISSRIAEYLSRETMQNETLLIVLNFWMKILLSKKVHNKATNFQYKTSSLKRNNEKANTACLLNTNGVKRQRSQKDSTFELLTKESLDTNEDLIIRNFKFCNSLAYYDILDLTPGTNNNFVKNYLPPEVYDQLITHEPTLQERDYNEIKDFINNMIKKSRNWGIY
ncbi:13994_t:CDS:2, partial [Dentiscutata erythropus]